LASRFQVLGELPAGGEADVVVVSDADDRLWVVKQYRRPDWSPSLDVQDVLADLRIGHDAVSWAEDPRTRHLVWWQDWGVDPASGLFWECQEYLSLGSLEGAGGKGSVSLGRWPVKPLTAALCDAVLAFHQQLGAHRDVKPANVLLRSADPLILVLADVGLTRQVGDLSSRLSLREGSAAYQAPEAAQGVVSRAGDWWAVGMLLAEAALGRHPMALPDGSFPDPRQMQGWLAQRDVPLDGIADERVLLLCRGLLTRDSEQRWRASQVRAWLEGQSPVVAVDASPAAAGGRLRSVRFAGAERRTPSALAAALAADPQLAGRTLFANRNAELVEDLRLLLSAHGLHEAQAVLDRYRSGAWQPSLLRLLAEMDPGLAPVLAGQDMSPAALAGVAAAVIEGGRATPAQTEAMDWALDHDLWHIWRNLPGMASAADAAERLPSKKQVGLALQHAGAGRMYGYLSLEVQGSGVPEWGVGGAVLLDHEVVERFWRVAGPVERAWRIGLAADPAVVRGLDEALAHADHPHHQRWWTELAAGLPHERAVALVGLGLAAQADGAVERHSQEVAHATKQQLVEMERRREESHVAAATGPIDEKIDKLRRSALDDSPDAGERGCIFGVIWLVLALLPLYKGLGIREDGEMGWYVAVLTIAAALITWWFTGRVPRTSRRNRRIERLLQQRKAIEATARAEARRTASKSTPSSASFDK
jgi:hypothetical protein